MSDPETAARQARREKQKDLTPHGLQSPQTVNGFSRSSLLALGDEVAEEARQRPGALEVAGGLGVGDAVLVVDVLHVDVADGADALGLVGGLRAAGGENLGVAEALADGLQRERHRDSQVAHIDMRIHIYMRVYIYILHGRLKSSQSKPPLP